MKKILISMLMISLLATSCLQPKDDDDDDDDGGVTTTIPAISINCSTSTDCNDNSADDQGGEITVILSKENCASFSGPTASNTYAFGAGMATCGGGTCTGNVSVFVDLNSNTISTIPGAISSLTVVAFIDTDGSDDGGPSTGEPLYCKDNVNFTQAITLDGDYWGNEPAEP